MYGAIASSSPVRAQVNFEGYNNVVAHSLGDPIVNGSTEVNAFVIHYYPNLFKQMQNISKANSNFLFMNYSV